jgi:DNA-binding LytR/AlgR family response regulator
METREFPIFMEDNMVVVRADEIVCVEVVLRKCFIYTTRGVYKSFEPMDHWKKTLNLACFYIPHKSFIINMRYVSELRKDSILLRYGENEKESYLARRKYAQFKDTYLFYLESVK